MYFDFPGQVQCIFLRNTSASDPGDKFPYNTSGFEQIPQKNYMFFVNADDLTNLDVAAGHCYNQTIAQNLTFGEQGLPLGIGSDAPVNGSANNNTKKSAATAMVMGESTIRTTLPLCILLSVLFALL